MDFNPDEIYKEVAKAGEEWADFKAAYEALDDATKSVLADITSHFIDGVLGKGGISKTEAEMRALSSGQYRTHLAEKNAARKAWLRSQVKYDSVKMLAGMRVTQESTRRAEMNIR